MTLRPSTSLSTYIRKTSVYRSDQRFFSHRDTTVASLSPKNHNGNDILYFCIDAYKIIRKCNR